MKTQDRINTEANVFVEFTFHAYMTHTKPFTDVALNVVFTDPQGTQKTVPGFWAGGDMWKVRYASPLVGIHAYRTQCSVDAGMHDITGEVEVTPYTGDNPLYKHGALQISEDQRHFEYADGTPFLWLADTWWKGLSGRLTWEGFQELTADRKAKGFNVIQIVCGPYPDEDAFDPGWANEGGMPYTTRDYTVVNPEYFDYADRRLAHLLDTGLMPALVGAWGRSDCNAMQVAGVDGLKRHWRYLVARYGMVPLVWIPGGEIPGDAKWGEGPWGEVVKYLCEIDPYGRLLSSHEYAGPDRDDKPLNDFELVGGSHFDPKGAGTLAVFTKRYSRQPTMPLVCGETGYEGHMQRHFADTQRYVFWMYMLNGAAGHTYGAAGLHHMGVEGDPGLKPIWDYTTWQQAKVFPGAIQVGLGKKLLEQYPWHRFEPHPEWSDRDCFTAGIPGEVRFIYKPNRRVYDWSGPRLKQLEPGVPYTACYFDPCAGRRFDLGTIIRGADLPKPFDSHTEPLLVHAALVTGNTSDWQDFGTSTHHHKLPAGVATVKGQTSLTNMVSILKTIDGKDLMVSVQANSKTEAGIVLRFQDLDNYLVALYNPELKAIYLLDRRHGAWGPFFTYRIPHLGIVDVPEIGPTIQLTAAASGNFAAILLSDGKRNYFTPAVKIGNTQSGGVGLWRSDTGEVQEYINFKVSETKLPSPHEENNEPLRYLIRSGEDVAPATPSPQDWVLVLERVKT